nr:hypothetical protein KPDKLGBK_00003 [uncultured bacterium]
MMVKKLILLLFVLTSFLSPSVVVATQELNIAETINQAGLQRMLSQRMAKNYILISQGINQDKAAAELDESAAIFEENLFNLAGSINTTKSKKALKTLKKNWYGFRSLVLSDINKVHTVNIVKQSSELLESAHSLVLTLEQSSKSRSDKLINVSGRQRMLSQRLALLYFASNSGYNTKEFKREMKKTANEFTSALSTLKNSKENSKSIKEQLEDVGDQWGFYKTKFNGTTNTPFSPRTITVITESILKEMNAITKEYELESIRVNKYSAWILG